MFKDTFLSILRIITGRRFHGDPVRPNSSPQLEIIHSSEGTLIERIKLTVPSHDYPEIPEMKDLVAQWSNRTSFSGGLILCHCELCIEKSASELWWHDLGWDSFLEGGRELSPEEEKKKRAADYPHWYQAVQRIYPELCELSEWREIAPSKMLF